MKQKLNYAVSITVLYLLLVFTGCKKEITSSAVSSSEADQLAIEQSAQKNECRLTEFVYNGGSETMHYNNKGLCDEWSISDYGLFKQEYDATGRLIKSRLYDENEIIYTVHFFYTGAKVTKEIWYYGNSNDVYDEVFYTFNSKGQNIRMESFLGGYYTVNKFDAAGDVTEYDFYYGGNLTYSNRSKYYPPYKNPTRAIPGINYGFPFLNAATVSNRFCILSEKLIAYDENGNPDVLYDYDPKKTSYEPASQHYPSSGTFYDRVTNEWTSQTFQYENCNCDNDQENAALVSPDLLKPPAKDKYKKLPYLNMPRAKEKVIQMRRFKK